MSERMANRPLVHQCKDGGIMTRTAWHWGGDDSVMNDPLRALGKTLLYLCLPPILGSASGDVSPSLTHS
jgi:hypothetical protein